MAVDIDQIKELPLDNRLINKAGQQVSNFGRRRSSKGNRTRAPHWG